MLGKLKRQIPVELAVEPVLVSDGVLIRFDLQSEENDPTPKLLEGEIKDEVRQNLLSDQTSVQLSQEEMETRPALQRRWSRRMTLTAHYLRNPTSECLKSSSHRHR
jgi:hypothetical protein